MRTTRTRMLSEIRLTLSELNVEAFMRRLISSMFGWRQVPGVSCWAWACVCDFWGVIEAGDERIGVDGAASRDEAGLGLTTAVEDMLVV